MDEALKQIAIQVPTVLAVLWFAGRVIEWVLNRMGEKMDRLSAAVEEHLRQR